MQRVNAAGWRWFQAVAWNARPRSSLYLQTIGDRFAKENDLEGRQDMGGKHGGQAGVPKPPQRPRPTPHDDDLIEKRPPDASDKERRRR